MSKKKPIVVDLFAGVGGLSLGATRAGFDLRAAVEIDKHALAYHAINFPKAAHLGQDIGSLSGESLLSSIGLKKGELSGLIGGPPCQGFSTIGRKNSEDPRNSLLETFFRLVDEVRPAFFLAENVPGLLNDRNKHVLERSLQRIPKAYKTLAPIKIKACDYGAPTIRTRVFFIGYDPERIDSLSGDDFLPSEDTADVKVAHALQSLPRLYPTWATEAESWRAVGELGDSEFERRIVDMVPKNVGNPDAISKLQTEGLVSGFLGTVHTDATIKRFEALKFGEVDSVSKSTRLNPDGYCPTLRAGTGPEKGSYQAVRPVHPTSPRVICPREAARLQGFPDWFQFHPTKWHAFRQIGNSVSPIVAERILAQLAKSF